MPLLIDGYNLLGAIHKSEEQHALMDEAGLCRMVSDFLRRMRKDGRMYFDGTGPRDKSAVTGLSNLEVIFSGPGVEADDRIEEEIEQSTSPRFLTVVSSDRRIRDSAGKRKAVSVPSDEFWKLVVKTLERKKKGIREPRAKREGLTESETEEWMKIFGL